MKLLIALILLQTGFIWAQEVRVEEVGKSPVEVKFHSDGQIRIDLCPGGIEILGVDEHVVRVSYSRGQDVRVKIDASDDRAEVKLSRCPHGNFEAKIEIPKATAIYVRMMAGQIDVRDVIGDKDVEVSFGQLNMDLGKPDQYAHVDASVNSGQVNAAAFNVAKGGLFRSFDQNGPGKYHVHAHVGAGQVDLR